MIYLYYIKGISRLDTPVFDNENDQGYFFYDYRVYSPIEGFYVPHFQDTIQLAIGEHIDFDKSINYLSFDYNNKQYYYFIDSVKYINEGLLELTITMDVIQTYMFNIEFINSEVTRELINRWTDNDDINRKYIRENLSSGHMTVTAYNPLWKLVDEEHPFYFILYKVIASDSIYKYHRDMDDTSASNYFDFSHLAATIVEENDYYRAAPDGYGYILVPYPGTRTKLAITREGVSVTPYDYYDADSWSRIHRKYQELPMAVSATIIPGSYASEVGITVSIDSDGVLLTTTNQSDYPLCRIYKFDQGAYILYTNGRCVAVESKLNTFAVESQIYFRYLKNTSPTAAYSRYYIPALIDENYMYVEVGERTGTATYPLHRLSKPTMRAFCKATVADNSRMYALLDYDVYDILEDDNLTTVHVHSLEQIALFNDYYQQYVASNYSTLTRGLALAREKNEYDFYTGAFIDMPQSVTKGFLKGGAPGGILSGLFTSANVVAEHMQNQYVIDEQLAIKRENLELTPDSEKMGNAGILDIIDETYYGYIRMLEDENLNEIGKMYESYGYKCKSIMSGNLFNIHNRYYYDIVQATNMVICLNNIISDELTLYNIKQRFESGLRMWHAYNDEYGHVKLRIEDRNLKMGSVCVYDNVEVDFL